MNLKNGDSFTWQETVTFDANGTLLHRSPLVVTKTPACPRCEGRRRVPSFAGSMACPKCC